MGKAFLLVALMTLGWQSCLADSHQQIPIPQFGVGDKTCTLYLGPDAMSVMPPAGFCSENKQFVRTAILSAGAVFGFDSNELSEEGMNVIYRLIGELADFKQIQAISVTGHTDSSGPAIYNLHLSQLRARYIGRQFRSALPGIAVKTLGKGESEPLESNESQEGRLKNRRVEIEVVAIK